MALLKTFNGMGYVLSQDKEVMDVYFRIPNIKELKSLGIKSINFEANSFEESWELMKNRLLMQLDDEMGRISRVSRDGYESKFRVEPVLSSYLSIDPGVENEKVWGDDLVDYCIWYAKEIEIETSTFIKVSLLFCDFALSRITTVGNSSPLHPDEVITLDWDLRWVRAWSDPLYALIDIEDYQKENGSVANIQEELDSKFEVPVTNRKEFKSFYSGKRGSI